MLISSDALSGITFLNHENHFPIGAISTWRSTQGLKNISTQFQGFKSKGHPKSLNMLQRVHQNMPRKLLEAPPMLASYIMMGILFAPWSSQPMPACSIYKTKQKTNHCPLSIIHHHPYSVKSQPSIIMRQHAKLANCPKSKLNQKKEGLYALYTIDPTKLFSSFIKETSPGR